MRHRDPAHRRGTHRDTLRAARTHAPPAVAALAAVALFLLAAPIIALGARVPWGELGSIAQTPQTRELLRVTLASSLIATAISLALGTPLALWMRHARFGAQLARLLVLLPLAMPPVVAGMALSAFIGRRGLAAPLLDALGWQFAFAFPGVVAAHVFITLPFVVITLDAALRQLDREVTDSAASVGIPPGVVTRRVVIPAIAPALATAAGLAFARSLGEFGTTLTFAGSMPGVTRTMPLGIYLEREIDQRAAYGLSAILVGIAVAALAVSLMPAIAARRRRPRTKPRAAGPVDAAELRHLTRPAAPAEPIRIGDTVFPAHATTALIGPNGAGKSTLLGRVAGRLRADAPVALGDRVLDAPGARPVPPHRRGVVLLTQNPGLPPTTTALGAVSMVCGKPRAAELLRAAGLSQLAGVPVTALSGGQAAQVALVRALAARPGALLLDEPLAPLDTTSAHQWRALLAAAAKDRTTVMITHNREDVAAMCAHTAVMERGEVVALRPTAAEAADPSTAFSAHLLA